ncbi:MAG TPA: DUF262 domain-containing protein [Lentisphaeria bacterium]|nr:MAG: hypothetical protein A2X45_09775 [Lentisphaerae bacterium GWF2_50_93]HCE43967.1 DUF262 domain-containing protein [Lentisphaeria bacterium]
MNQGAIESITSEQVSAAESQILEQTKRIDYYLTEYSIELLADKMEKGEFETPDYQREYTWEEGRKWRFIESILMNLPIPFLFFWENPKSGKLEIVDGVQRLSTIHEFLHKGLVLGDLEKLPALTGFSFADLPESRQRKLKNRSIRGIVLNEHADDQARFDLFDRINTGSKVANKAEIRRGALRGPFMDLVIELAKDASFIEIAPVTEKQLKEREREELVTRFFAYGDGLDNYDDEVSVFLYAYTREKNVLFTSKSSLSDEYRARFLSMVAFVAGNFPYGFRRAAKGKASPRARFESIAVGSYLALKQNSSLKVDPIQVSEWVQSKEFSEVTGADGANAISRLRGRIYFVRDKLLEF